MLCSCFPLLFPQNESESSQPTFGFISYMYCYSCLACPPMEKRWVACVMCRAITFFVQGNYLLNSLLCQGSSLVVSVNVLRISRTGRRTSYVPFGVLDPSSTTGRRIRIKICTQNQTLHHTTKSFGTSRPLSVNRTLASFWRVGGWAEYCCLHLSDSEIVNVFQ